MPINEWTCNNCGETLEFSSWVPETKVKMQIANHFDDCQAPNVASVRGHSKNARNQLETMLVKSRRGEPIDQDSIEYALDEVKEAIDEL